MSFEKNRPHRMPQDRRSAARQWFSYPRICRFFDYSDTLLAVPVLVLRLAACLLRFKLDKRWLMLAT